MNILAVTNSRSDWGIYRPLLEALKEFKVNVVVAGMHLSNKHGLTVQLVSKEFKNLLVNPEDISVFGYEQKVVKDFKNETLTPMKTDWVIVLGDTWPMLDYTIRAVKKGLPVVHVHGGDVTGSIDDSIRHAITRFAHLHFPSIQEHADRLLRMGEEAWRIKPIGPLGIYAMKDELIPDIRKVLGLNDKPIILVIQHPVSTEKNAKEQMNETLEAVNNPAWQPVIIYPNNEVGYEDIIGVICNYPYKRFQNLPYLQFVSLLKESAVIVGNSSCAIVEAPLFGVPAVNIGSRQDGRTLGAGCFQSEKYNAHDIRFRIDCALALDKTTNPNNPYLGYENGIQDFIKTLKETPIDKRLLEKRLTF
jgi:GDP/UDP-N,N'-diacetylbacillosamine 2-epimerase (hydrolysing)